MGEPIPSRAPRRNVVESRIHVITLAVDDLDQAVAAGAAVVEAPHERPWGIYSGYFSDPDGHLWEVIWNPAMDRDQAS